MTGTVQETVPVTAFTLNPVHNDVPVNADSAAGDHRDPQFSFLEVIFYFPVSELKARTSDL
jgi:hypothetical protein